MARRSGPRYMQTAPAVVPMGQPLPTESVGDVRNMIVNSPGSSFGFSEATAEIVEPEEDATSPVPDRWVVFCPNCDRPWSVGAGQLGAVIPCLCSFEIAVAPPSDRAEQLAAMVEREEQRRMEAAEREFEERKALRDANREMVVESRERAAESVAEAREASDVAPVANRAAVTNAGDNKPAEKK